MAQSSLPFPQEILAYLLAIFIAAPVAALIGHLMSKAVTGFETRYLNILLSTTVGLLSGGVLGAILLSLLHVSDRTTSFGIRAVVGWTVASIAHLLIIRGRNQEKLTRPRALALTATQAAGGFVLVAIGGIAIGFFLRK